MTDRPRSSATPYHCPNELCSAISYILDMEEDGAETWCAVSCYGHHVYVSKRSDLQEVTNRYWPTKDQ